MIWEVPATRSPGSPHHSITHRVRPYGPLMPWSQARRHAAFRRRISVSEFLSMDIVLLLTRDHTRRGDRRRLLPSRVMATSRRTTTSAALPMTAPLMNHGSPPADPTALP